MVADWHHFHEEQGSESSSKLKLWIRIALIRIRNCLRGLQIATLNKSKWLFSFFGRIIGVLEFAFSEQTNRIKRDTPGKTSLFPTVPKLIFTVLLSVLRIRILIHRIHMFLGFPDPDPLIRGMDPDPDLDPSIIMQK